MAYELSCIFLSLLRSVKVRCATILLSAQVNILRYCEAPTMKILVFLHGTTIMHRGALGQSREERVRQVIAGEESVRDYEAYVPVGNAVEKLHRWRNQGAEIIFLSS